LRNNAQKSSIFPIQCSNEERSLVQQLLPCQISDFPCCYLGLPLSLKNLTRNQLQPFFDKIADQLPGWKADLLTKPHKARKKDSSAVCFDKYADLPCNGGQSSSMGFESGGQNPSEFLLVGSQRGKGRTLSGGVGQSVQAYGVRGAGHFELKRTRLGIENEMALAVQNRPLLAMVNLCIYRFQTKYSPSSWLLCILMLVMEPTLFWRDRWLNGKRIADIAQRLLATIPKRRINKCTVQEGLTGNKWIMDIRGALTVVVFAEYLHLWNTLS
jgi:hypothetical protein